MLNLLLAAALAGAAPKPLFVPPRGFERLTRDPLVARQIQRGGVTFLVEYRKTVHQNLGRVITSRSIAIVIGKVDVMGMGPRALAQTNLTLLKRRASVTVLANRAAALCDGRRGWLIAYHPAHSFLNFANVYARGLGTDYVAMLKYPRATSDKGASRALNSLCPPPPAIQSASAPMPFTPPVGWYRGNPSALGTLAPPYTAAGLWVHLSPRSTFLESLALDEAPADKSFGNPPGVTVIAAHPQTLCGGQRGMYVSYRQAAGSRRFVIERLYGDGTEATYILTYTRLASDPQDPAARKALESLCPPEPPSPPSPAGSSPPSH